MGSSIALADSWALFPNLEWSYDVFLSFRGEDTRSNFTSHLVMALQQKGVNVFIDDKLNRGEQISESLFRSIEESLTSIVIFSENYAYSSWCLDELVKIMECKKSKGQIVWPIFYKVDPSDVRKQTGSFGEAFTTHQAKFKTKIQIWRDALTAAANLSGWDLGTRKEADLIQDLIKEVSSILKPTCMPLYVAKYPVGIDSQLKKLRSNFNYWTQDEPSISVYMVGIYGMGGIGKTTLAKALYNKIAYQFEACCFLSNVREASKKFNGLVQLQETLLYEILKVDLKVDNLDRGINFIRNRLRSKKVLIALDDVDKLEQLEVLVGGHDWFGAGSIIIVTTRNRHLLSIHEFDQKYRMQRMNLNDALKLFSWHAFKKSHPPSTYLDLSKRATSYCKGHPLALVVLGSFLCTRYDQAEWASILDEFENSLNKDINDILQISFDGLEEKVKEIFHDISCFLAGEKVDYVKNILNACHFNADFGIIVLMDLSLIIVENDKGTDAIKTIKLELPKPTRLDVDPRAFRNMKNLRVLMVGNARFSTDIKYLPNNLKWIKWHGFAQKSLPSSFITKDLVGLDLQHSLIRNLGKELKDCQGLKFVDLSYSTSLEKISDFSAISSNFKELYLSNCTKLRTIPTSIASLDKLVVLDLNHCSNLKKLPNYLMLKSLKILKLGYCEKLEELPDFSPSSNLQKLYLNNCTKLRVIPESIRALDSLLTLDLTKCTNLEKLSNYLALKSLVYLKLSGCSKLEKFPEIDENMKCLRFLDLDFTAIKELPSSIGCLNELSVLDLEGCTNLISLPSTIYLLPNLRHLRLNGCSRIEMLPNKWHPTNDPVCSSPNHKHFVEFTISELENCKISNADFMNMLCDVAPFSSGLLLSENKFSNRMLSENKSSSPPSCPHKFKPLWNLESRDSKLSSTFPRNGCHWLLIVE
ncbi:Disease resistance protein RUN1, partial [Cucurbita argyrosperma subsp. sororia]